MASRGMVSSLSSICQPPPGLRSMVRSGITAITVLRSKARPGRGSRRRSSPIIPESRAALTPQRCIRPARSPVARRSRFSIRRPIASSNWPRSTSCRARHSARLRAKTPGGSNWRRRASREEIRADGLAQRLGHDPARISSLLARLRQFDPPGVFARSLAECLALQLVDRGQFDEAMGRLIENLDLLATGDRAGLMQRCGVNAARLSGMIGELRRLDPRPGLAFDRSTVIAVIPDLTIERSPGGGWQIELNDETMPRLAINESYPLPPAADVTAQRYLKERRTTAHWLLRALDRRAETLLRVAGEIVARQGAFLEGGAAALKPLSRRQVAAVLGLHESTVGRATVNKYAATPRGVLALVDFFGGRLSAKGEPAGHAPAAVRVRLKGLIEAEPTDRPISDDRLAALLRDEGIAIARRTVAKYREMLRIPPSFQRG